MSPRVVAGVVLLVVGLLASISGGKRPEPTPAPMPANVSFRGMFVSDRAASDAATLAGLLGELADCIEADGMLEQPRLRSGAAFDDLRIAAREARCRGESIGQRQPAVRDAIHRYLDEKVGPSGGPVSPQQRAAWISAFRELSRACEDAAR
jgi:hypothetical protein